MARDDRTAGSTTSRSGHDEARSSHEKWHTARPDFDDVLLAAARDALEAANEGILIIDPEDAVAYVNERATEILGVRRDEIEGGPIDAHLDEPLRSVVLREIQERRAGERGSCEVTYARPDGETRHLRVSSSPILDEGEYAGAIGVISDRTERKRIEAEIERRERRFRALVENSEDIFSILDREGRPLYRSPAFERVFGYTEEEHADLTPLDLAHPEDRERGRRVLAEAARRPGETLGPYEFRLRAETGEVRVCRGTITNLLDDPAVNGIVVNWRDVTKRVRAERRKECRARQQAVVARLGRNVLEGEDVDFLVRRAVEETAAALDVPHAAFFELQSGEDTLLLRAGYGIDPERIGEARVPAPEVLLDGGSNGSGSLEWSCDLDPHGTVLPELRESDVVGGVCASVRENGRPTGLLAVYASADREWMEETRDFLGTVADVIGLAIERTRAERELRFRAQLLDAVGQGVIATCIVGRVVYWNRTAERIFGPSASEMEGLRLVETPPWAPVRERMEEMLGSLREGESVQQEVEPLGPDGNPFPALLTGTPLEVEAQPVGMVVIVTDLTEVKELEEKYIKAQRMEAVGRLAGGIAHDFNNLLTTIHGYADLAASELPADHPVVDEIREIRNAVGHAGDLTRQLLAYSRKQIVEPKVVVLNEAIESIEGMLRRIVGEDIRFELSLDPTAGAVRIDPGQLEQILMNLTVNARHAMPRGGIYRIGTSALDLDEPYVYPDFEIEPGEYAVLTVSDTGRGMSEDTREHAFEPFFTTRGEEGTGLGLATVYGCVKQSGGYIWVYSEPGAGATFKIYLPRHDEPDAPENEEAFVERPARRMSGTGARILVVEDEETIRALAVRILRNQGYEVVAAADAKETRDVVGRLGGADEIDLVFTDIVLPDRRGPELARSLLDENPDLPVVYSSGYAADLNPNTLLEDIGVDTPASFLPKPYTPNQLIAKVEEVLGD